MSKDVSSQFLQVNIGCLNLQFNLQNMLETATFNPRIAALILSINVPLQGHSISHQSRHCHTDIC